VVGRIAWLPAFENKGEGLFPNKGTLYLNILHASWPAGLVVRGAIGWMLGDQYGWHWKWQLGRWRIARAISFSTQAPASTTSLPRGAGS
jgi:hypothetical protein